MESTTTQRALADPLLETGPQNPNTIVRRLARAAFRGKVFVIVCVALGGLVAGFIALAQPNIYESRATFRLGNPRLNPDPRCGGPTLTGNAPHLLQAPELMRWVAKRVGVAKVGSIEVSPYRRANLLEVAYSANDPLLAQEILTAYVDEAQKFHMEIYGDRESIQLVKARHDTAKKRHTAAKNSLKSFLAELQVHDFMAEYELAQEREFAAREKVSDLEIEIQTLEPRIHNLESELARAKAFRMQESTVEVPNPKIAALTTEIQARERELIDARIRFKEDAPEVRRILAALELLNKNLAEEQKRPTTMVQQVARVPSQQHQRMTERLADAHLRRTVARESRVAMQARLVETAERVKFLGSKLDRFKDLNQTNNKWSEELHYAELALAVAHAKQRLMLSNLAVLSLVVPPSRAEKVGPKRQLMVLMGLLAGLGIALAILAIRTLTGPAAAGGGASAGERADRQQGG
ncbi:MAG: GumC domain-containing protein [Planctomycetota bacterium]|jgi:uncharacterized protein involved in exopolysaccharide biosynthesis